jgi:hypothetical protein
VVTGGDRQSLADPCLGFLELGPDMSTSSYPGVVVSARDVSSASGRLRRLPIAIPRRAGRRFTISIHEEGHEKE